VLTEDTTRKLIAQLPRTHFPAHAATMGLADKRITPLVNPSLDIVAGHLNRVFGPMPSSQIVVRMIAMLTCGGVKRFPRRVGSGEPRGAHSA
jgi:hypothetical protein